MENKRRSKSENHLYRMSGVHLVSVSSTYILPDSGLLGLAFLRKKLKKV